MLRCTVVFLCGCESWVNVRYRKERVDFVSDVLDYPCGEHAELCDDTDNKEAFDLARGPPHRMRLRSEVAAKNRKLRNCDCGHRRLSHMAWRVRNYGQGPDIYVCEGCVCIYDDAFYSSGNA